MRRVIDLSIVILTYNTCSLTQRCLEAIEATSTLPYSVETILVDNASTDGTVEMLRRRFPNVCLVRNEMNEGFARGNNVGLAVANGRYLMLLNSDTEVLPDALKQLVQFMDDHPNAGACGPQLLHSDGSLQPSGRSLPTLWSTFLDMSKLFRLWKRDLYFDTSRNYNQPATVGEISGAALLVRRTCYEQCGGLDPAFFAYYEDVDWCKRIGEAGWLIYYVPSAKVIHLWQGTSRHVSERAYRAGQDSARYYFCKHHGRMAAWVIQAMLVGKELFRIGSNCIQLKSSAVAFHWKMLRGVLGPLSIAP